MAPSFVDSSIPGAEPALFAPPSVVSPILRAELGLFAPSFIVIPSEAKESVHRFDGSDLANKLSAIFVIIAENCIFVEE